MNTSEKLEIIRKKFCPKTEDPIEIPNGQDRCCPFCVSWDTKTNLFKNVYYYFNYNKLKLDYRPGTKIAHESDSHYAIAVEIVRQYLRLNGKNECNHQDKYLPGYMHIVDNIEHFSSSLNLHNGKNIHDPVQVIELLSDLNKVKEEFENIKSYEREQDEFDKKIGRFSLSEEEKFQRNLNDWSLQIIEAVGSDFISSLNPENYRFPPYVRKVR